MTCWLQLSTNIYLLRSVIQAFNILLKLKVTIDEYKHMYYSYLML